MQTTRGRGSRVLPGIGNVNWKWILLLVLLFPIQPALASYPGINGRVAYTKVVDKDTGFDRRAIFVDARQVTFPLPRANTSDNDTYPAYSPDGKQLAFVRRNGETGQYFFYVAKADGADPIQLATLADVDVVETRDPNSSAPSRLVWSPDGKGIGFRRSFLAAPIYTDQYWKLDTTAGTFTQLRDTTAAGFVTGFDWIGGPANQLTGIVQTCIDGSLRVPNGLFCVSDLGGGQRLTSYAPTADLPNFNVAIPQPTIPHWAPDHDGGQPKVMFLVITPMDAGGSPMYVHQIYSVFPAFNFGTNDYIGQDLTLLTHDQGIVSCAPTGTSAGPIYAPHFLYGEPTPSPDGQSFLATKTESRPLQTPIDDSATTCSFASDPPALYAFRSGDGAQGKLIDTDVDSTLGVSWQPSPALLNVTVTDGHGDELRGVKVELRDYDNQDVIKYQSPENGSGGQYQFDDAVPARYALRVTLEDSDREEFDVRHTYPSSDPVWAERTVVIPPGATHIDIKFDLTSAGDLLNTSLGSTDTTLWDRLDSLAAIFYETRRYFDWVHANLTDQTIGKVSMYAYATQDNTGPIPDDGSGQPPAARYGANGIYIPEGWSDATLRESALGPANTGPTTSVAPLNVEWHELSHFLDDKVLTPGYQCMEVPHGGILNKDTCDSLHEGFAMFMAAQVNGSPNYTDVYQLDTPIKRWGFRVGPSGAQTLNTEDGAVAALLWDLVDTDSNYENTQTVNASNAYFDAVYIDNIAMPVRDLWSFLQGTGLTTVYNLRLALDADPRFAALTVDLDFDAIADVTKVDDLFLMHGFFPVLNQFTDPAHHKTYPYSVETARTHGDPPNAYVGLSSHGGFDWLGHHYEEENARQGIDRVPGAEIQVSAQDALGKPIQGPDAELTVHYPGKDYTITQRVAAAPANQVHLELPAYFDYLPPVGSTDLPACDPEHDLYISVTLTGTINGYASSSHYGFDNCQYIQSIFGGSGAAPLSYTLNFPEDSTPPHTQIATSASTDAQGPYTTGTWTVSLQCDDPVVNNFAVGCYSIDYSIDGGPWAHYAQPVVLSDPGLHAFAYRSVDASGNEESVSTVSLGIVETLDLTAPVTTVTAVPSVPPRPGRVTMGTWTVTLSCSDPPGPGEPVTGCARTEYLLDGGPITPYSQPLLITGVAQHKLIYRSLDGAGNNETYTTLNLTIIPAVDTDHDGVVDDADNCLLTPNPDQRDTDADGFGNACDADFNNNGKVDSNDLSKFKLHYGGSAADWPDYDLNGDGKIDAGDLAIFQHLFGTAPGPTGVHPPEHEE